MPHLGEFLVSENDVDKASSVNGWVGVDGSCDLLDTTHDDVLFGLVASDDGEHASSFTVDTEVLGEGLEEHDVVSVLSEESEGVGVLVEVTGSEALVGIVETAEEILGLDDVEDLVPLGLSWVDTGWVVCAGVEEDEGVVLGSLEVILHAFEIEALGGWLVVSVTFPVITAKSGKISVEWPGWVWEEEVDILVWVPVLEEGESNSEGASSGEGLGTSDSSFVKLLAVVSVGSFEGLVDVGLNTVDWLVFVIHILLENNLLGFSDAWKDVRLSLVASVGSKTEEHLVGVRVSLEGLTETKNRVCRSSVEAAPG